MNKSKKLLIATIVGISCVIMWPNTTKAALQSNGGTPASYNVNSWITGIRQMQATGQALGLTDEINGTNLTSTNTNLDIHMQKNTEYGAMVLLSASAYGKPDKVNSGETTTGNKTGVVMNINGEWTAAGPGNTAASSMANAKGRYKNKYPDAPALTGSATYSEKVGDAVATTGAWYGATGNKWIGSTGHDNGVGPTYGCIVRNCDGSIFSYNGWVCESKAGNVWKNKGFCNTAWHSRAVVVVGSGI